MTSELRPEDYLPHTAPMLMVSEIQFCGDREIRTRCQISADNPMLHNGLFPVYCCTELLAQSAGVLLGTMQQKEAVPKSGAIVQIREFTASESEIRVGDAVIVQAEYVAGIEAAAVFKGTVTLGDCDCQVFSGQLMIAIFPGEVA